MPPSTHQTDTLPATSNDTEPPIRSGEGSLIRLPPPAVRPGTTLRLTLRRRAWPAAFAVAVVVLAVALYLAFHRGAAAPQYKSVQAEYGPIAAGVTATGTVSPVISVVVGSQVSGTVQELLVDFNSPVTKGQVVARIDPEPFEARVAQARAAVSTARANIQRALTQLEQKKLEYDRAADLRKQDFVSQADLDLAHTNHHDAIAALAVARAQAAQAEASLASAALDLSHTEIYSPVDGIVVSRNVDVGQTVIASLQAPTLFVIAKDLTHMQVDANVSESDIGGVHEGSPATFTVDAYPTRRFQAGVTQVRNAPISIQNVVTYDVVIQVNNEDLALRPGMTANVAIETVRKARVLRLPAAALRFRPPGVAPDRSRGSVWVLREGQIESRAVTAGITDGSLTEIVQGDIHEGDSIVVSMAVGDETEPSALPPGFGLGPRMR
jgi:HlyD family secretion protein